MKIWTEQRLTDSLLYSWEDFQKKHPGVSNYNGWKAARHTARQLPESSPESVADPNGNPDPPKLPPYEIREDGNIFINRLARTIVSHLGEHGTLVVSFERHAAMRRRYSDEWENDRETIPAIARDFEMSPAAFRRYKELHGWTHDSDPFTDEEWESEEVTPESAVDLTIESHRRAFHKKLEKRKWAEIVADADRWRRFDQMTLSPLLEAVRSHAGIYIPPVYAPSIREGTYDLVFCPTDIHYGKYSWDGRYTRSSARQVVMDRTKAILDHALAHGRPRKIITAIGSDFFHIDTNKGTTTEGTPQDIDGTPHEILWKGAELALDQMHMLRAVAPLEIYAMLGNHDRLMGYALLYIMKAWFHTDIGTQVHESAAARQYCQSGSTLLGFAHGDGAKLTELPMLMAHEAATLWGTAKHRIFFTGHLHYEHTRDIGGVLVCQLPSISGIDRWHDLNGYTMAKRALAGYMIDHEEGLISTIHAPVL